MCDGTREKKKNHQPPFEEHNPSSVTVNVVVPLHNLLTMLTIGNDVAAHLLTCVENGEVVYRSCRQDRLVGNTKK